MRCDKCGKRFEDNWVPMDNWPKYDILQRCGVTSHTSMINLCTECSRKFKEWLEKDAEDYQHEADMYIPKKSPNFTLHIFDSDFGETIARDIPLSDEKAREIFDNCEKIKAEKSENKMNQLHEDEE